MSVRLRLAGQREGCPPESALDSGRVGGPHRTQNLPRLRTQRTQKLQLLLIRDGIPQVSATIRLGAFLARDACVSQPKRFVYILKSVTFADEYYVGVTGDVASRIGPQ